MGASASRGFGDHRKKNPQAPPAAPELPALLEPTEDRRQDGAPWARNHWGGVFQRPPGGGRARQRAPNWLGWSGCQTGGCFQKI